MSGKAKAEGLEGFNGTLYYMACEVVDMFSSVIGDADAVAAVKDKIAQILGLKDSEDNTPNDGSQEGNNENGEFSDQYA